MIVHILHNVLNLSVLLDLEFYILENGILNVHRKENIRALYVIFGSGFLNFSSNLQYEEANLTTFTYVNVVIRFLALL